MSNIVKTREDLVKLKEFIKLIQTKWFNKDSMEEILTGILPKDENGKLLVNYNVNKEGSRTAIYIPRYNVIDFSIEKCKRWVIDNLEDLGKFYNVEDMRSFGHYLSLFIMLHEVEHSYQYLIGQGKVECDIPMVKEGYKTLTELMIRPNYILPHPIKQTRRAISLICYYRKQNEYVLERNANVEAFSTILALAYDSGNEEMMRAFTDLTRTYMSIGYLEDNKGAFYHTFEEILMMDKYKRINNTASISEDERMRYGLEIADYKRFELLEKVKRRTV